MWTLFLRVCGVGRRGSCSSFDFCLVLFCFFGLVRVRGSSAGPRLGEWLCVGAPHGEHGPTVGDSGRRTMLRCFALPAYRSLKEDEPAEDSLPSQGQFCRFIFVFVLASLAASSNSRKPCERAPRNCENKKKNARYERPFVVTVVGIQSNLDITKFPI